MNSPFAQAHNENLFKDWFQGLDQAGAVALFVVGRDHNKDLKLLYDESLSVDQLAEYLRNMATALERAAKRAKLGKS